jgi:hypothetical protein
MPETVIDLGKRVKAKYPGSYDDLDDAELGRKVKTKYPGSYDDFTEIESTPAPQQKPLPASQSPEFQMLFGASPADTVKRMQGVGRAVGKVGMGALQYVQHLAGRKVSPTPLALEPSPDPNQRVGEMVGEAALTAAPVMATGGASLPVQAAVGSAVGGAIAGVPGAVAGGAIPAVGGAVKHVMNMLPSKARAGAKFQQLHAAAGDMPLNTKGAEEVAAEALNLTRHGAGAPPAPIREFLKRRAPVAAKFGGQKVQMSPDPVTLDSGLKFSSNAGRLSADAASKLSPSMQRKLAEFGTAMKTANREAAAKVGMGEVYDEAMKEYARAASLAEKAEIAKRWGVRALAAGALGGAGITGAKVVGALD